MFYPKTKKGKKVYDMHDTKLNSEIYKVLNKCHIEPQNLDDEDVNELVEYATTLDYLSFCNLVKNLSKVPDDIWGKINNDERFRTHLTSVLLEERILAEPQNWGKRAYGIN